MSFRRRLTAFLVLAVAVPMVTLVFLLIEVNRGAGGGQADAALDTALQTARSVTDDTQRASRDTAARAALDERLQQGLDEGDRVAVARRLPQLRRSLPAESLEVRDARGRLLGRSGPRNVLGVGRAVVRSGETGDVAGTVRAATRTSVDLLREMNRLTGVDFALIRGGSVAASTVSLPDAPDDGDLEVAGRGLRAASVEVADPDAAGRLVALTERLAGGLSGSRWIGAFLLVAFLALAALFTTTLMRELQGQVRTMLTAARRIGKGDFDHKVPVAGHDEMAGLATEFNRMSEHLSDHVTELRRQRERLQGSMRRVGDSLASGLDRDAVLTMIVRTAVDACSASFGRFRRPAAAGEHLAGTRPDPEGMALLEQAEDLSRKLESTVERSADGRHAMAGPIRPAGRAAGGAPGTVAILRSRPFRDTDRELFGYLLSQAAVSLENAALHELVARQAITDQLTGLANKRQFDERLEQEVGRSRRFGHPLALMMLDLDDFKAINDTYGHRQGDEVLRTLASVLGEGTREVDEAARIGGEEFAVVMPETDEPGAHLLAERVRQALAAEHVPLVDGEGTMEVTASVGVAAMPVSAVDSPGLVAAADAALYEAKRQGKNRSLTAGSLAAR
ncbi:MAG: diguanylate cyclase [Solirubrobacterales bacterium]